MSVPAPSTVVLRTGETCVLRSVELGDARALIDNFERILLEPHAVTAPGEVAVTEAMELDWIERHRSRPGWVAIAAEVDGELVGHVDVQTRPRRRLAHVGGLSISVQPPWQGRGVGEALMRAALRWAEAEPDLHKLGLAVFAANERAIRLYENLGITREGRRVAEIRLDDGTFADDLLMARWVG